MCLYDKLATEPTWAELHQMLVQRYKEAKEKKTKPTQKFWAVWSGEFNRYGRTLHEELRGDSPYIHLFAMWSALTRLLELNSMDIVTEVHRKKKKKLTDKFKAIYILHKKRLFDVKNDD